jgi:hypothetical protein
MENVVIVEMGVEGGGATIYGHQVSGAWTFWQEGTSMFLDDNDDEDWRSWTSEPVSELSLALPKNWWTMYATTVNPEFASQLRREYDRCRGTQDTERMGRFEHKRWLELFAEPRQDG